ncbi:MAG: AmmeMemoRadiSam system protein A [Bacillota bacterium]
MAPAQHRVVFGALAPHPPIIIPEVGRGEEQQAHSTVAGMMKLGELVATSGADTLVLMSPHSPIAGNAFLINAAQVLSGDFAQFGAPSVRLQFTNNPELVKLIRDSAQAAGINCVAFNDPVPLDHGLLVPLYYVAKAGFRGSIVPISVSLVDQGKQFRFGQVLASALERQVKWKVGFLASGDLSHRLLPESPAGYDPAGAEFDKYLVEAVSRLDAKALVEISPHLAERAGECGLRPATVLLGLLDRYECEPQLISYEGPFGVGYAVFYARVVQAKPQAKEISPAARLARQSLEYYLRTGKYLPVPADAPAELTRQAAAFVSIHRGDALRGCIGTIVPTKPTVAEEIIHNAVAAGLDDPRFDPVRLDEMEELRFKVDVLSPLEQIRSPSQLNPKVYGVLVRKGHRSGVLLPDLPGIDSVDQQLLIAKQKAGIDPSDKDVELYRFTVTRYE